MASGPVWLRKPLPAIKFALGAALLSALLTACVQTPSAESSPAISEDRVKVPSVTDLPAQDARSILESEDLAVSFPPASRAFDAGWVVASQSRKASSLVEPGTQIVLLLEEGPTAAKQAVLDEKQAA